MQKIQILKIFFNVTHSAIDKHGDQNLIFWRKDVQKWMIELTRILQIHKCRQTRIFQEESRDRPNQAA